VRALTQPGDGRAFHWFDETGFSLWKQRATVCGASHKVPCARPRPILSFSADVGAKTFPHTLQKKILSLPAGSNIS
jgi:hypothetical protein